ncbi:MAG: hypothetical protein ACW98K_11270 [Candidatus Kariarchaeaceae archaeon]
MPKRFYEYEGRLIGKSTAGRYYEITKWNTKNDGSIVPVEKRLLSEKELKEYQKQFAFHAK